MLVKIPPDFEAQVAFIPPAEGGSRIPRRQAIYRPGFQYEDEPDRAWAILPVFLDERGAPLPDGEKIPLIVSVRFYIPDDPERQAVHRPRLAVGLHFNVVEGRQVVARGVVTKILSLHEERG